MIGTRLGPYEITAKLGEGGMGEVYRATDTRLGREVAVKVLPESVAQDPERLARFEREAKILASLNHNNIATIHGIEEGGSAPALVMELVEGPTLADRIAQGAIPVEDALPIAKQIAEGLEYAHERGIVHRDLKPANIKLTTEGQVKILDFGLAKALEVDTASAGAVDLSHSPTLTYQATVQGLILGTASYMSPEQAAGKPVDKRSDIWSFGVVLHEMLTGARLFTGDSAAETLAGVLKGEIDLDSLPGDVPPAIRRLIRRCLERSPKNRLHDIADARIAIEEVLSGDASQGEFGTGARPVGPRRRLALWTATVVAAAAAGVLGLVTDRLVWGRSGEIAKPMHLTIRLASDQELGIGGTSILAFSPDGSTLVFSGHDNGRPTLFRRRLADAAAAAIEGTDNGRYPFFSPDGQWLGFYADGFVRKVPMEGGRSFPLAQAQDTGGGCWLDDGTIIFNPVYSEGLFQVSAEGGKTERLTTPDHARGVLGHWWPRPLPGDRRVLFTAFRTPIDTSRIGVLDLDTRQVSWVVDGGFGATYVSTGHLLYAKGKRLYAVPFDAKAMQTTGPAVALVDDLETSQTDAFGEYAVSTRGTLAYATETLADPPGRLVWIDRKGNEEDAIEEARRFVSLSLSPDARSAAATVVGESQDLWTFSFGRKVLSRLTTGPKSEFGPVWAHDGRSLIYDVDEPPFTLFEIDYDKPDSGRPLWKEEAQFDTTGPTVSPDGKTIAFVQSNQRTGSDVYVRPLDGSGPAHAVRATQATEDFPTFSPDGRWLAYESNESGRYEVYAEPLDGSGDRLQVSAEGGLEPLWATNGELFFRHADEMRVVTARTGSQLELGPVRTLFRRALVSRSGSQMRTYDVTPDGSRILAIAIPEESRPRELEIITDWTTQLPQLAPAAKR